MFLALDRNSNRAIDGVEELFGDGTFGPDGKRAANGFEALRKYDLNGDERIDANDAIFSQLLAWSAPVPHSRISNSRLRKASSVGIRSIDLRFVGMHEVDDYGNETLQRSTALMRNGELRLLFDIWFRVP